MSWFFGKSSSNTQIPATTPLQQQRLKQIKSLSNHNFNVTEIKRDFDYKVTFISNNKTFALHIHLPVEFPNEKPFVTINPNCYHPWVDSSTNEVKGCASLNSFYMHSDLGKTIQHIVKEMKKSSPVIRDYESPSYTSSPTSSLPSPPLQQQSTVPTSTIENPPPSYLSSSHVVQEAHDDPDLDAFIQDLSKMSKSELEHICIDPDIMLERIEKMASVEKLKENRRKCIEENESIAKSNMEMEPVIDDLKGDLKHSFETYNELFYSFQEKARKQNELSQIFEIGNILTNLRISVMQSEEESEQIVEEFLSGKRNLDSYLTDFIDKRKQTHLRRVKEERTKCLAPY